ncbi:tautomerase family protein [Pseudonocardia sp.]|uniref:tautomerase family protein n=1 Tax=Pseudonocardia sp. TaxID=60912 RepID=UPI003455A2EC
MCLRGVLPGQRLLRSLTDAVVQSVEAPRESVRVIVSEVPETHCANGDVTLAEKRAGPTHLTSPRTRRPADPSGTRRVPARCHDPAVRGVGRGGRRAARGDRLAEPSARLSVLARGGQEALAGQAFEELGHRPGRGAL